MKIILLVLIGMIPFSGICCSAFKYIDDNQVYVAKNFDWYSGQGYILKNSRNVSKCTYLAYDGSNTCWTSKFGSITFNQNGKEFPYGGINERGLVIEMLFLKETNYKEYSIDTPTISELEWIQYQLDNFSRVDEIISNVEKLKIDPITATIHYFITDQTSKSIIVEFINGDLIVSETEDKLQAITNSSCEFNNSVYEKNKSKLGLEYIPAKPHSPLRYCSIKNNLLKRSTQKQFSPSSAFEILDNVADNREVYKTYWSIVYDLKNLKIKFKTFQNQQVKSLDLQEFDFDSPNTLFYDLSSSDEIENISTAMKDYSPEHNYKLIEGCIQPTLMFNYDQLNKHQMNPSNSNEDEIFAENHKDIEVTILTTEASGSVKYFLAPTELDFRRQGPFGCNVEISSNSTKHTLYSVPMNGKYAYGAMHDLNGNGFLDRNFMKMPKEPFAFSGKKRFFFFPPKFDKATFDISEELTIEFK